MPQATIAVSFTDQVANISAVYTLSNKGGVYHRDPMTKRWTKTTVGPNTLIYRTLMESKMANEPLVLFPNGTTQSIGREDRSKILPDWAEELIYID